MIFHFTTQDYFFDTLFSSLITQKNLKSMFQLLYIIPISNSSM